MLKRILSPKASRSNRNDVQSCPRGAVNDQRKTLATIDETCTVPNTADTGGAQKQHAVGESDASKASSKSSSRPAKGSDYTQGIVQVTVGERVWSPPATFFIPNHFLADKSTYFQRAYTRSPVDHRPNPNLPYVKPPHFFDFFNWLLTGRITGDLPPGSQPEMVEIAVKSLCRTLVDAVRLGVYLGSEEYQTAAMMEFLSFGRQLQRPEDYVNGIFGGTATPGRLGRRMHPARKMIVAVVAAKRCGRGQGKAEVVPAQNWLNLHDPICWDVFWHMYDAYVRDCDWECDYPESIEEFSRHQFRKAAEPVSMLPA